MKTFKVLVLWLGALVPAFATPARVDIKETSAFRVIPLEQPNEAVAFEDLDPVDPQPLLEASPYRAATASGNVNNYILYGNLAEDCDFPYQVAIRINNQYFCGGSLIDGNWILTAAHCIVSAQNVKVFAGAVEWREAPVQVYAKRAIVHGRYNEWIHYDIGLLELGENIEGDCIESVELETLGCGTDELDDISATASGWGLTNDTSEYVEEYLRYVGATTITNNECYSYYGPTIIESGICSVSTIGANGTLCSGDSGGPLVYGEPRKQIGINSFVSNKGCEADWPNGYARVPCFIEWIKTAQAL